MLRSPPRHVIQNAVLIRLYVSVRSILLGVIGVFAYYFKANIEQKKKKDYPTANQ